MQRQQAVLNLVLLIGVLQGSITLVASKCDGVCVKLDECDNDFAGINFVNLRFGEEDYVEAECPHYLEICCDVDKVVTTPAPPKESAENRENSTDQNVTDEKPIGTLDSGVTTRATPVNESEENRVNSGEQDVTNEKPTETLDIGVTTGATPVKESENCVNSGEQDVTDEKPIGTLDSGVTTGATPVTTTNENQPGEDLSGSSEQPIVEKLRIESETNPDPEIKQFGECGIRNPGGIGFHIQNSKFNETQYGEFPWMVAVLQSQSDLDQSESSYACGGSLIAPNVVLTVAHCVMDKEAQKLTVRAGEWDTMTKNEIIPHQEQSVSKIILHPHFNRNLLFHDVALLVLKEPFSAEKTVQLACLPPQGMVFKNNDCFAAGWGKTAFDAKSYHAILKRVPVPIVPRAECQTALRTTRLGARFRLHESFICAGGEEGIDTCTGDGGSPLVCPVAGSENKYYQAGIVAWGINCAQSGIPGVYVQASLYTKWIDETTAQINFMSVDRRIETES